MKDRNAHITLKDEPDYLNYFKSDESYHMVVDKEDKLKEKLKSLEEKNLKDR